MTRSWSEWEKDSVHWNKTWRVSPLMFMSFHEVNTCERQIWNTVASDLRHFSFSMCVSVVLWHSDDCRCWRTAALLSTLSIISVFSTDAFSLYWASVTGPADSRRSHPTSLLSSWGTDSLSSLGSDWLQFRGRPRFSEWRQWPISSENLKEVLALQFPSELNVGQQPLPWFYHYFY